ncbi:hypothetical protein [uncultured Bacteroides sp.]|uniref:hypothetical protein n=1 Tax=uncultured Bacteroides sp. TaxID=162156 RepID=UPI002AA7581E|nr:hypothetical protein [uncultured Bacteroides sp.]
MATTADKAKPRGDIQDALLSVPHRKRNKYKTLNYNGLRGKVRRPLSPLKTKPESNWNS